MGSPFACSFFLLSGYGGSPRFARCDRLTFPVQPPGSFSPDAASPERLLNWKRAINRHLPRLSVTYSLRGPIPSNGGRLAGIRRVRVTIVIAKKNIPIYFLR